MSNFPQAATASHPHQSLLRLGILVGWLALATVVACICVGAHNKAADGSVSSATNQSPAHFDRKEPDWMRWDTETAALASAGYSAPPDSLSPRIAAVHAGMTIKDARAALLPIETNGVCWRRSRDGRESGVLCIYVGQSWTCMLDQDRSESFVTDVRWRCSDDNNYATALLENCEPEERQVFALLHDVRGTVEDVRQPARILRAVNALVACGKEKATRHLRAFLAKDSQLLIDGHVGGCGDTDGVLLVAAMLYPFDHHPNGGLRDIMRGPPTVRPEECDRDLWPGFPMAVVSGVPFRLTEGYFVFGSGLYAEDCWDGPDNVLERYIATGTFRKKPLVPRVSPLDAAERLITSESFRRLDGHESTANWIRWQAVQALGPALERNSQTKERYESLVASANYRVAPSGGPEISDLIGFLSEQRLLTTVKWDSANGEFTVGGVGG